jgi:hypothetical protein
MTHDLTQYLESIRTGARLDHNDEPCIMSELKAHIEDKLRELTESGLSEEEAERTCIGQMGSSKEIAREIYETYSQGSWKQVLMAAMPHFTFGVIFVLNWWRYPQWLATVLLLTAGMAFYGWGHGKPAWVFPWLGYSLLPVIAVGLLLLHIPSKWSFLGLIIYFPLAGWWLLRIVIQTTKKDWLLSTMMLLPLPVIIGWFMAITPSGKMDEESLKIVNGYAPWIGLTFIMLGFTIGTFIRLRQRRLRVSLLAISGLLTLTIAVYLATGRFISASFIGPLLGMWAVLLVPPLLERQLKKGNRLFRKSKSPGEPNEPAAI